MPCLTKALASPMALLAAGLLAATSTYSSLAVAQGAPAAPQAAAAQPAMSATENLVARIALYPDDLIAIILPAATQPLDIVEADRFLEKRKKDPKAAVPADWDDAVKSLLNYPVVVTSMSQDLDWTKALGDAVTADQAGTLAAVQSYRRKVNAAGNLKSDAKQNVVVEKEVITIVQADPQVIYVPQYDPVTVTIYGGYSSWGYYGSPYPVYYYPYAPGAAIAAGIIWGAAIGSIWNGGRYVSHYDGITNIRINNGDINIGSGNRGDGNRGDGIRGDGNRGDGNRANVGTSDMRGGRGGDRAWSPGAAQSGPKAGNRVGDGQFGDRAGGTGMGPQVGNRASGGGAMGAQPANRAGGSAMGPQLSDRAGAAGGARGPSLGGSYGNRAGSGDFGGSRASAGQYGGGRSAGYGGGNAFSSYGGSRHSAGMSSSRGAMSRGGGRRR